MAKVELNGDDTKQTKKVCIMEKFDTPSLLIPFRGTTQTESQVVVRQTQLGEPNPRNHKSLTLHLLSVVVLSRGVSVFWCITRVNYKLYPDQESPSSNDTTAGFIPV
uniref:Uncharacterized protein n=1 Tax=Solanum lycopersicum TaxID=4081 RepID=A0A3Q7HFK5_SOLLC